MTSIANDIHSILSQLSEGEEQYDFTHSFPDFYYHDSDDEYEQSTLISSYSLRQSRSHSYSDASLESYSAFPPPKAIFFNTSIDPITTKKHHIQIFSKDLAFSTILKEDSTITVGEIIQSLKRKLFIKQLADYRSDSNGESDDVDGWVISLVDEPNNTEMILYDNEKIIKIQNKIFRSMWIDEKELPNAILKFKHSFKFIIRKLHE